MELIKKDNFKNLKKIIQNKYYEKILVIGGKKSYNSAGARTIINKLIVGKKSSYFFKRNKLPEINELLQVVEKIRKFEPNLIIAIGGGAVMDLAKVANLMSFEKKIKKSIQNNFYITRKKFCDLA